MPLPSLRHERDARPRASPCPQRRGRRVGVVVYGHPTVADATTEILLRQARREGHAVHTLAGVSSVAALLAEAGIDPSAGLLVCTGSALLEKGERAPRPALPEPRRASVPPGPIQAAT